MLKKQGLVIACILGLLALSAGVAYAADDPPPGGLRVVGKVTSIDPGTESFTLEALRKGELTVHVSSATKFRSRDGDIHGLGDLEVGMPVVVAGTPVGDGELQADVVTVGKPGERPGRFRLRGEITGISLSDGVFTLKTPSGEEVHVRVSERTRFFSRDDSIHGIEDLEVGMFALAQGVKGPEGQLNALRVAAGSPEDRPDIRSLGVVTAVGEGSFTLESRQGRSLTFEVDESTRYRSRDGSVTSFDDLEVGMHVAVFGDKVSEGTYKAIVIGVGLPKGAPEGDSPVPPPAAPGA